MKKKWLAIGKYFFKNNQIYRVSMYYVETNTYSGWNVRDDKDNMKVDCESVKIYEARKELEEELR